MNKKIKISPEGKDIEIAELKERIKNLEESRHNLLHATSDRIKVLKKQIEKSKVGVAQVNSMLNGILISVALQNGGKITVDSDLNELLKKYSYKVTRDEKNYTFEITGGTDEQVQSKED